MASPWHDDPAAVRPMLAATATAPLDAADLAYEPKYDGIRAVASVEPPSPPVGERGYGAQGRVADVRLWSRLGNEKTTQFPEVAAALREWARGLERPVVLDGEIVALDDAGRPVGFQNLQGRIHLKGTSVGRAFQTPQANPTLRHAQGRPEDGRGAKGSSHGEADARVAYIVFDLLRDGEHDLRTLALRDRRARLETLLAAWRDPRLRLSEQSVGDGRALHARAQAEGWEGLIAKRLGSTYTSGRRSPDWRKLKLVRRQACVVGGWTDPRGSRPFFGALLLGVYEESGRLQYVGHSGAGFTDAELGRVWRQLRALESKVSPFAVTPRTNERPHWVQPKLVADVKFTEWTADGKLRHPTYVGLRDDIAPGNVRREPDVLLDKRAARTSRADTVSPTVRAPHGGPDAGAAARAGRTPRDRAADRVPKSAATKAAVAKLLEQIDAIEGEEGDGVLLLPGGDRLEVSNLRKVFWPKLKLTKGDLFRHYVRVAPYILPVLLDRPLVMKRYPNGVEAKPFYQHRAPDKRPAGVRVAQVTSETETRSHIIGGSLVTLLYTTQLASISQDPWLSRVDAEDVVDHVAIDLDPPEGMPFPRVLDVARWVRDELNALDAPAFAKTSGSGGMHIYVPMPPGTPYQAGLLFCQIVATMVARKHPKTATVERSLRARGQRVYVDYLQNVRGKTLASAYSARANDFAGVSMPVAWDEIEEGVSPRDFTIRTSEQRLAQTGDLWAPLRKSRGADLRAVMQYAEP